LKTLEHPNAKNGTAIIEGKVHIDGVEMQTFVDLEANITHSLRQKFVEQYGSSALIDFQLDLSDDLPDPNLSMASQALTTAIPTKIPTMAITSSTLPTSAPSSSPTASPTHTLVFEVHMSPGSYKEEVFWYIGKQGPFSFSITPISVSLGPGDHMLTMVDRTGDGWDGADWTLKNAEGVAVAGPFTLEKETPLREETSEGLKNLDPEFNWPPKVQIGIAVLTAWTIVPTPSPTNPGGIAMHAPHMICHPNQFLCSACAEAKADCCTEFVFSSNQCGECVKFKGCSPIRYTSNASATATPANMSKPDRTRKRARGLTGQVLVLGVSFQQTYTIVVPDRPELTFSMNDIESLVTRALQSETVSALLAIRGTLVVTTTTAAKMRVEPAHHCPAGRYSEGQAVECTPCTPGKYAVASQANCTVCNAGRYASISDSSSCAYCPHSYYQVTKMGTNCQPCVDFAVTVITGSLSANDCQCRATTATNNKSLYYMNHSDDGDKCLRCPDGASCTQGTRLGTLDTNKGSWRATNTTIILHKCPLASSCKGGQIKSNTDDQCTLGYSGLKCKLCDRIKEYAKQYLELCVKCKPNEGMWVLGTGLAVALAVLMAISRISISLPQYYTTHVRVTGGNHWKHNELTFAQLEANELTFAGVSKHNLTSFECAWRTAKQHTMQGWLWRFKQSMHGISTLDPLACKTPSGPVRRRNYFIAYHEMIQMKYIGRYSRVREIQHNNKSIYTHEKDEDITCFFSSRSSTWMFGKHGKSSAWGCFRLVQHDGDSPTDDISPVEVWAGNKWQHKSRLQVRKIGEEGLFALELIEQAGLPCFHCGKVEAEHMPTVDKGVVVSMAMRTAELDVLASATAALGGGVESNVFTFKDDNNKDLQVWEVPMTATYRITAASAGNGDTCNEDFHLMKGAQLEICFRKGSTTVRTVCAAPSSSSSCSSSSSSSPFFVAVNTFGFAVAVLRQLKACEHTDLLIEASTVTEPSQLPHGFVRIELFRFIPDTGSWYAAICSGVVTSAAFGAFFAAVGAVIGAAVEKYDVADCTYIGLGSGILMGFCWGVHHGRRFKWFSARLPLQVTWFPPSFAYYPIWGPIAGVMVGAIFGRTGSKVGAGVGAAVAVVTAIICRCSSPTWIYDNKRQYDVSLQHGELLYDYENQCRGTHKVCSSKLTARDVELKSETDYEVTLIKDSPGRRCYPPWVGFLFKMFCCFFSAVGSALHLTVGLLVGFGCWLVIKLWSLCTYIANTASHYCRYCKGTEYEKEDNLQEQQKLTLQEQQKLTLNVSIIDGKHAGKQGRLTENHAGSSQNPKDNKINVRFDKINVDSIGHNSITTSTDKPRTRTPPEQNAEPGREAGVGCGLTNLGNTCYMSSVLQCLTHTAPLQQRLLAKEHSNSCRTSAHGFCVLCWLEEHVSKAVEPKPPPCISPSQLYQNIRGIAPSFRKGRQEDAHEFLRRLIDAMQKCYSKDQAKLDPRPYPFRLFQGKLRSRITCLQCEHCSDTFDAMEDLSLEIRKDTDVVAALRSFCTKEYLKGDDQYKCEKCNTLVGASKQIQLYDVPEVMTLQLKRFDFVSLLGGKISKHIGFQETLNLAEFVGEDAMPQSQKVRATFRLYGVLVHAGNTTQYGHYYCYVKDRTGIWYKMDDSSVMRVQWQTVQQDTAYMLFYHNEAGQLLGKQPRGVARSEAGNMAGSSSGGRLINDAKKITIKGKYLSYYSLNAFIQRIYDERLTKIKILVSKNQSSLASEV
jgi:ubiquitin C-terminal hydrolase